MELKAILSEETQDKKETHHTFSHLCMLVFGEYQGKKGTSKNKAENKEWITENSNIKDV